MSLEVLLRRRLVDEAHRQIVLTQAPNGWQASLLRPAGTAYRVETSPDPVDALWNLVCDLADRRNPAAADEDLIG